MESLAAKDWRGALTRVQQRDTGFSQLIEAERRQRAQVFSRVSELLAHASLSRASLSSGMEEEGIKEIFALALVAARTLEAQESGTTAIPTKLPTHPALGRGSPPHLGSPESNPPSTGLLQPLLLPRKPQACCLCSLFAAVLTHPPYLMSSDTLLHIRLVFHALLPSSQPPCTVTPHPKAHIPSSIRLILMVSGAIGS